MSNIYEAPTARLDDEPGVSDGSHKFYVVAPLKFWLLFIFTFGSYQIYWFYKNWSLHKASTHDSIWPVPRAIFAIFFTHSLFREVDATIVAEDREHSWNPGPLATGYVIALIATRLMDRVPSSMGLDNVLGPIELFVMLPVIGFLLYRAQCAINAACGDPSGSYNARLTWANYLWMVLGFLSMALFALGLYAETHGSNP